MEYVAAKEQVILLLYPSILDLTTSHTGSRSVTFDMKSLPGTSFPVQTKMKASKMLIGQKLRSSECDPMWDFVRFSTGVLL